MQEHNLNASAFLTPLCNVLCLRNDLVQEFYIDSTYKTNRQNHELFVVLANVNGAGYPVAYLLVDTTRAPPDATTPKTVIITDFLRSLSAAGMNPQFMFSDKDAAQMRAIETVFENHTLRLCIWHMLKAVGQKLSQTKSQRPPHYNLPALMQRFEFIEEDFFPSVENRDGHVCPSELHSVFTNMMKRHYTMHPLIPMAERSECRLLYKFTS